MKTTIKTLFATSLIALVISNSTVYAAEKINPAKEKSVPATAFNISSINKINVSGNIEVTLVQNAKSNTLFTNEGNEYVSVKKVGNSLIINSKNSNRAAKITVYLDEIYRIEASDNASIVTENQLNLKYLQVFLKDNANVNLNTKTEALLTKLNGNSALSLKGSTDLYTIEMDKSATISLDHFKSGKTEMQSDVFVSSRK